MKLLAVTGHRYPEPGYKGQWGPLLLKCAESALEQLRPELVRVGMASGWDMAVAVACARRKVPYEAWIPYADQAKTMPFAVAKLHKQLLAGAARRIQVCKEFSYPCIFRRNEALLTGEGKQAEAVLALYSGKPGGGTAWTCDRAVTLGIPVLNMWAPFQVLSSQDLAMTAANAEIEET